MATNIDLAIMKFPVYINGRQRIEKKAFMGHDQYYLYTGHKRLTLLDPEDVEDYLELLDGVYNISS